MPSRKKTSAGKKRPPRVALKRGPKRKTEPAPERKGNVKAGPKGELTGWTQIAAFLGHPAPIVQKWAKKDALPVVKQGRHVTAKTEELNEWLGRGQKISGPDDDLIASLKAGIKAAKRQA